MEGKGCGVEDGRGQKKVEEDYKLLLRQRLARFTLGSMLRGFENPPKLRNSCSWTMFTEISSVHVQEIVDTPVHNRLPTPPHRHIYLQAGTPPPSACSRPCCSVVRPEKATNDDAHAEIALAKVLALSVCTV